MKLVLAHRNTLSAMLVVPALAAGAMMVTALGDFSPAQAQQQTQTPSRSDPDPGRGNGFHDDPIVRHQLPPCQPGTPAVLTHDCRPWTPPTHTASSTEDCECAITYKTINGRRVAVKDCYVLLPNNTVGYCMNPRTRR